MKGYQAKFNARLLVSSLNEVEPLIIATFSYADSVALEKEMVELVDDTTGNVIDEEQLAVLLQGWVTIKAKSAEKFIDKLKQHVQHRLFTDLEEVSFTITFDGVELTEKSHENEYPDELKWLCEYLD